MSLIERIGNAHLNRHTLVMGVVNVTPDSFSDGGRFLSAEAAVEHGLALADQGADLLDVGGESTRPGAEPVAPDEELKRVVPVVEGLSRHCDRPISIDTSKAEVMRAAVAAGAGMINDVCALRSAAECRAAAELGVPVCIMHMRSDPRTMQDQPSYRDVVDEVYRFLAERIDRICQAGLDRRLLIVDPGFGFGKTLAHNLALLRALERFRDLDTPVLAGLSRKSMLGQLTGRQRPCERVAASLAAAVLAAERGAAIVRVHDVAETVDALAVWRAVQVGCPGELPTGR